MGSAALTGLPFAHSNQHRLAARRVDDQVHSPLPDRVLVTAADAHRDPDDLELRVAKAERHGAQRALGAALDVAVPADHVLAVIGDRDMSAAGAVDPSLEDIAPDVAHGSQNRTPVLARLSNVISR